MRNRERIVEVLRAEWANLLAVYAFGSRVEGTEGPESDLDLAVLVEGYADPLQLWRVAGELADLAGCPVDLLDLRAASTVMQYRILTTGERWWHRDLLEVGLYEAAVLSEKLELDATRAGLIADIRQRGSVHGR